MKTITIDLELSVDAASAARDHLVELETLFYELGSADSLTSVVLRRLHAKLDEALDMHEWEEREARREARLAARPTIAEKWGDDEDDL